jgi:integrase
MKPQFTKGGIYKDGQYYYFKTRDSVNDKQIKRCTYETTIRKAKSAAKKILNDLYADAGQPKIVKSKNDTAALNTITEMLDKYYDTVYLENLLSKHSPEKQKKMITGSKSRFAHLKRIIGNVDPAQLDSNLINSYIKARREDRMANGKSYSDGSIQIEINFLKASIKVLPNGLKFTVRENVKGHNKLTSPPREVTLTDQEYNNILAKFREYDKENKDLTNYAFFIEMLRFTGVRWGQMQLLEYKDIKKQDGAKWLQFPAAKVKHEKTKPHIVYINQDIYLKLRKCYNSCDIEKIDCNCSKSGDCKIMKSNFVFVNKNRRCEHFGKDMLYVLWHQFCEELNYTDIDEFKKDGWSSTFLPHDIRRTYIVTQIRLGTDRSIIMSQTGHKSHKTFDQYNVIQPDTMNNYVENQNDREAELRQRDKKSDVDDDKAYDNMIESIWE